MGHPGHLPAAAKAVKLEMGFDPPSRRLVPLDAQRGLLMGLMAIDHASLLVRGVHSYEAWHLPPPVYADWSSFWTRFVTHMCAPGFFFLMGAGLTLRGTRREDRLRVMLRGLLLILLEQLLVDPVLYGTMRWTEFGVLSALGAAMVVGALLVSLRPGVLAAVGVALVLLCQLPPRMAIGQVSLPLWAHLLFLPGGTGNWFVLYPLLPWLGVVLLGMAFGFTAGLDPARAYRTAAAIGAAGLIAFVLLRSSYLHHGWMVFLSLVKYPPSLDLLLLTLGLDLLLLWLLSRAPEYLLTPLLVYGRSALFFYVLHWHVLAALALRFPRGQLGPMYAAWALAMAAMYPLCLVWGRLRSTLPAGSLWRLL